MIDGQRNMEATIYFHKAIAVALLTLDEFEPEDRTSSNFMLAVDELLAEIPKAPYVPGFPDMEPSDMFQRVKVFRANLETALNQARRARSRLENP